MEVAQPSDPLARYARTSHTASVSDRAEPGPEGDIRRREAGCEVG